MRMRTLVPGLLLAMAACGNSSDELPKQTTVTIEKANALRFQVVDDDSDYMRRVALQVADADKVTAREDVWHSEAVPERVGHDWYLEAADRAQLASYFAKLGRDANFAVPQGHQIAYQRVEPGKWRSYYLHSPVVLDGSAVASADASTDGDRPLVHIELTDSAARDFGDLTLRITGKKLAMIAHDEVLSAPIVNGQIAGGQVSITLDRDGDAEALAKALAP